MVQIYRNIPDHFSTHVNPTVLKVDEWIITQIIVVVMTMDDPAVELFFCISRIMNQQKTKTPVFQGNRRNRIRFGFIVITSDKGDPAFEFFPVLGCR